MSDITEDGFGQKMEDEDLESSQRMRAVELGFLRIDHESG